MWNTVCERVEHSLLLAMPIWLGSEWKRNPASNFSSVKQDVNVAKFHRHQVHSCQRQLFFFFSLYKPKNMHPSYE